MKYERYKNIPQLQGKSRSETTELIKEARKKDRSIFWIELIGSIVYGAIYVLAVECIFNISWESHKMWLIMIVVSAFTILYLFAKLNYGFFIIPRIRKAIDSIEMNRG